MKMKRVVKNFRRDYRSELFTIAFLAVVDVAAIFGLRAFTSLTGSERLIIELFITFVVLVLSIFLILNRSIALLGKGTEPYTMERFDECKGSLRRLAEQERRTYEVFMDNIVAEEGRYAVDKSMMYLELIKFANAMSRDDCDEIRAVSSIEISNFQRDPFAMLYLDKNADCVACGVPVRRIFLLTEADLSNRDVLDIIVTHGKRLCAIDKVVDARDGNEISTGVKWINKRYLSDDERRHDLAIFDKCIVARQRVGEYELTFNDEKDLAKAEATFKLFWEHTNCEDYTVLADRLKQRRSTQ